VGGGVGRFTIGRSGWGIDQVLKFRHLEFLSLLARMETRAMHGVHKHVSTLGVYGGAGVRDVYLDCIKSCLLSFLSMYSTLYIYIYIPSLLSGFITSTFRYIRL
jgi:hypothetical protein